MHIDLGGIIFLVIIAAIIFGIFAISRLRKGEKISFSKPSLKKEKDTEHTLCFNIYPDKYAMELMFTKNIDKSARVWKTQGKKHVTQGFKDNKWFIVEVPKTISYSRERLAGMMGCLPYRKLQSIQFGLLEQLAPFMPVMALAIAGLLFIIILG